MANQTTELEAFDKTAKALSTYVGEVQNNIRKMQDAATDCSDNMGHDVYSQTAIKKLDDCTKELQKTISEANELIGKILARKREIENSISGF